MAGKKSNSRNNKKKKIKATIPGQGTPFDTATAVLWNKEEYFAEIFNKIVFKKLVVDPSKLKEASNVEAAILRVRGIHHITLKNMRDVSKVLLSDDNYIMMILGIENQNQINYQMPFRVMEVDLIQYAHQIEEIVRKNREEHRKQEHKGEYIGGFWKTDKLKPVITLVIYYGEEEWKTPLSLRDMFYENEGKYIASDYKMHLLDVRHMNIDELDNFSPDLKAFIGFLRLMGYDNLTAFMEENRQKFYDLPETTIDALIEITKSEKLKEIKKNFRTESGGVNMLDGIKMYGQQQRQAGMNEGIDYGAAKVYVTLVDNKLKTTGYSLQDACREIGIDTATYENSRNLINDKASLFA